VYAIISLVAWTLNTLLLVKEYVYGSDDGYSSAGAVAFDYGCDDGCDHTLGMYARALPHSIIIRAFWVSSSIVSIIKLHTATRMFQSNTMQAFNYYINVFVFIAATCIAILGLFFVKSHQSFDRYTALPAHALSKESYLSSISEVSMYSLSNARPF
jgi:hypothetical protein